jgi:Ni,Fe-hydrogenase III large subunit
MGATFLPLINGQPVGLAEVPSLAPEAFRAALVEAVRAGAHVSALFARPVSGGLQLVAVLADPAQGLLQAATCPVGDRYPSLTPVCPQVHWFEREIAEQWGVVPEGHPWLKPIRFHASYRPGHDAWGRDADQPILPGDTNYWQLHGKEVHEVAVGPVHAGVIEPGSFRFQCHGEHVYHLEVELGYQHRGVEKALRGGPTKRTLHYMETLAGDTTIGHSLAYCQALEGLAGCPVPPRAHAIRGIALELERLANHTGDLGALAGDVGFLPTLNYCGRLRGDYLNSTALICGNRFGRSLVIPGGVNFDVDAGRAHQLQERLGPALRETEGAANLLWDTVTVQARFDDTCPISRQAALDVGLVGMVARACGVDCDVRHDFPFGIFRFAQLPVSTWHTGDVFARAYVRFLEIQRSGAFIQKQLGMLPGGKEAVPLGNLRPDAFIASLTEGWRGEICHVAITGGDGRFDTYKVVDPSFHYWFGMFLALRKQQISDFPLCNKSFNLSYCGHDL